MPAMTDALAWADAHAEQFLADLKRLIDIPSVSASPAHADDRRRCAEELGGQLARAGLHVETLNADRPDEAPVLFAQGDHSPDRPTVLIYGHYDVVGVSGAHRWRHDPFDGQIDGAFITGRGATDDKGQLLTAVKAIEAIHAVADMPPVNVKLLIEGEEEVSSAAVARLLAREEIAAKLACDVVAISDGTWFDDETPTICSGVRGLCECRIEIAGPARPLHSGVYGGAVANPATVLVEMLGCLRDANGTIAIPGFADAIAPVDPAERAALRALPFDEERFRHRIGVRALERSGDISALERTTMHPAMDIVAIAGGSPEENANNIIPMRADAVVGFRLVPHQRTEQIQECVAAHLKAICPPSVEMHLTFLCGGDPYAIDAEEPMLAAAREAVAETFGRAPILLRSGGSIPIVPLLNRALNAPVVMCDLGLPDDHEHSDNERFALGQFSGGIEMYIRLLHLWGTP